MGLFNWGNTQKTKKRNEATRLENGYEIGVDSGMIYHCPKGLTKYVLPEGTKKLSISACDDMRNTIEELYIPASFSSFVDVEGKTGPLATIETIKTLKKIHFAEGIENIDSNMFDITKVEFNVPNSVKKLGPSIYTVSDDGTLIIGDNVTYISEWIASHDYRIKRVEIFGNIGIVPHGAFNQCKNINTVILHEGIMECGRGAFFGTNKLQLVELPDTFSGDFDASMEGRPGEITLAGKKYNYKIDNIEQERESTLTIIINRSKKKYIFKTNRGKFGSLNLRENEIYFFDRYKNEIGSTSNISSLNPNDWHIITDGRIESRPPLDSSKVGDTLEAYQELSPKQQELVNDNSKTMQGATIGTTFTERRGSFQSKISKKDNPENGGVITISLAEYEELQKKAKAYDALCKNGNIPNLDGEEFSENM